MWKRLKLRWEIRSRQTLKRRRRRRNRYKSRVVGNGGIRKEAAMLLEMRETEYRKWRESRRVRQRLETYGSVSGKALKKS